MVKKFSKCFLWIFITVMMLTCGTVFAEAGNPYEEAPEGTFCWPLPNCPDTNSPMYDRTGVVSGSNGFHTGWDFAVSEGTDIYAIGAGTVVASGSANGIGYYCIIKHTLTEPLVVDLGNGETVNFGTTLYSRYCHQCRMPDVKSGDWVAGGQIIGHVGNTGLSTGPHLHMDIMSQNPGVSKSISSTEGFLPYSEKRGKPVYKILATKGSHQKANFAPNMVCGVLKYKGNEDKNHEIDTSPDYGTGNSFGTGNAGSRDTGSTVSSYGHVGAVGLVGGDGRLIQNLLDPGTGITDQEDDKKELTYTGVMTDYGTLATFNNLSSKMKDVLEKYSRIIAALLCFIGTVTVGSAIILQNRNPEQRTFLITGLFAVGIGSLIVVLAVYIVNMVIEYM